MPRPADELARFICSACAAFVRTDSRFACGFSWKSTACFWRREECRNPNYLNAEYFGFLRERGLAHMFLQGYYMPPIFGIYEKCADQLTEDVVIRLHGPDREGMEERTSKDWSRIIEPRDADLDALATMLSALKARRHNVWVFVNNHYEGCAPLTRLPLLAAEIAFL